MFLLNNEPKFAIAAAGNLLKASEYRQLIAAEELIQRAQQHARQIVQQAEQKVCDIEEEGYRAGEQRSAAEWAERLVQHTLQLHQHIAATQGQLTDVVVKAVEMIIGEMQPADRIGALIKSALGELVGQNKITVLVHPEDVTHVDRQLESIRTSQAGLDFLNVETDPCVPIDTCVLSTAKHVIDASVPVQLETLRQILEESFPKAAT